MKKAVAAAQGKRKRLVILGKKAGVWSSEKFPGQTEKHCLFFFLAVHSEQVRREQDIGVEREMQPSLSPLTVLPFAIDHRTALNVSLAVTV